MNKYIAICLMLLFLCFCGDKSDTVDVVIEDGVEILFNKQQPYKIKGEPSIFSLKEDFTIDFERADLAENGIDEIRGFAVDSKGDIFCLCENEIFLFDGNGQLIRSFGKKGQGPGEFDYPWTWWITEKDEFAVYDYVKKLLYYDKQGRCTLEIKLPPDHQSTGTHGIRQLDADTYLSEERITSPESNTIEYQLLFRNAEFEETGRLQDKLVRENPFTGNRIDLSRKTFKIQLTPLNLYLANQENPEFEVTIYDRKGNRVRSIRKEYRKVKIPQHLKDKEEEDFKKTTPYRIHKWEPFFDEYYPAIRNLYVDGVGHILVETYEEGEDENAIMMDLFTKNGIYVGRISQEKSQQKIYTNGRLYSLHEKENGYQKLVVSILIWE